MSRAKWVVLLLVSMVGIQSLRAELIVSYLSNPPSGTYLRYTNEGAEIGQVVSGGGEGVACVVGATPALFLAENSGKLFVMHPATFAPIGSGSVTISGASSIAAVAFSPDGATLYAADYGTNRIYRASTAALIAAASSGGGPITVPFVSTTASHDVVVDAAGIVYATHFQNATGIKRFDANLNPLSDFLTPSAASTLGLTAPGAMLIALGSLWISNFSGTNGAIYRFDFSGSLARPRIAVANGEGPFGMALGPNDGNIYVAMFLGSKVSRLEVANGSYALTTFIPNPSAPATRLRPKYLQFTEHCTSSTNAFLEICKSSSLTNPVTGTYEFRATNGAFTTPPITVPAGFCSGPIPVPSGSVTVTETAIAGTGVSAISAYGYTSGAIIENRLLTSDLANRTATVNVPAGTISSETIVDFTNFRVPTGVLEICKDVVPRPSADSFTFHVSGAVNSPFTVPAGACSGPIVVQAGSVTITEVQTAAYQLLDVSSMPPDRLISVHIPEHTAVVNVPAGDTSGATVIRFRNTPALPATGQLKLCKIGGPGVPLTQSFLITANGAGYSVPAGPASRGGFCVVADAFPVGTEVTVQENPPFPYRVLGMSVDPPLRRKSGPTFANGNGQIGVTIGSGFTEVTVTNAASTPMGQLKLCKIAGTGVAVGTNFTMTVATTAFPAPIATYTVPAGPAQQGGYCVVDDAFPVGSTLVVSELPSTGHRISAITINGAAVANNAPSANVTIGNGITEIAFTNAVATTTQNTSPFLNIVHYELVGEKNVGTQVFASYRAHVVNAGTALSSLTATVSSTDPAHLAVDAGNDVLSFGPVPANSQTRSSNTFTLRVDSAAAVDFSKLQWTFDGKGATRRRRAAGGR